MNLFKIFILSTVIFSFAVIPVFSQEPTPQTQPAAMAMAVIDLPPTILVSGREKESFQKVIVDKAKIGQPIKVDFLIFDRGANTVLTHTIYGLPSSAKFNFELDEQSKNRAVGHLTWTPVKLDKGFKTIILEVSNGTSSSKLSLSYDVE